MKAGYLQQGIEQAGLAHLLEHMAMRSTTNFPNVWAFLESLGVQPGLESNAATGGNETFYWFLVPSDSINIRRSLLLLSDIAQNIKLDKEGIDSEKKVVINEISRSGGYQQRLYSKYFPLLIRNSSYSMQYKDAPAEISNLNNFSYRSLVDFYQKWYCADTESVAVVGDIDLDRTKYWIEKYFAGIARCGPINRVGDDITLQGDNLFRIIGDSEIPNTEIKIFMRHAKPFSRYEERLQD